VARALGCPQAFCGLRRLSGPSYWRHVGEIRIPGALPTGRARSGRAHSAPRRKCLQALPPTPQKPRLAERLSHQPHKLGGNKFAFFALQDSPRAYSWHRRRYQRRVDGRHNGVLLLISCARQRLQPNPDRSPQALGPWPLALRSLRPCTWQNVGRLHVGFAIPARPAGAHTHSTGGQGGRHQSSRCTELACSLGP